MTKKSKPNDKDINVDRDMPLDLKGAEQHHELENQPGDKGDPDHASDNGGSSDQLDDALKDAVEDGDDDTAVGSALKKAVED